MTKYAKLIEGRLEFAPKNKGAIVNYNLDVDQMLADGYKLFVQAEIPVTNRMYHIEYVESLDTITETIVYDETQEEADAREYRVREEKFYREFFYTCLGWVRRTVTKANGEHADFLLDYLPIIQIAAAKNLVYPLILYREPDYTQDVTDWTQYQIKVPANEQFINECLAQVGNDFVPQN